MAKKKTPAKKIIIGCPVHNRDTILNLYLDSLSKLYCYHDLGFFFLANNCDDATTQLLRNFSHNRSCRIEFFNEIQSTSRRVGNRYHQLVDIRNKLREYLLQDSFDYYLSVDSDIMLPPQALMRLLEHELDAVSGLVYNDLHMGGKRDVRQGHICNILSWSTKKNKQGYPMAVHIRNYPDSELIPVDVTGACILMSRRVVEQVEYAFHPQGEDLGWSINLQMGGFQAFCDTSVRTTHLMTQAEVDEYRKK
jgi:hypothetical protein